MDHTRKFRAWFYISALEYIRTLIYVKQLCSSSMYKHNLYIWSRLGDLVRCILNFLILGSGAIYVRFETC